MPQDIELRALTKSYGPVVALNNFTHTFAAGQVHALIGKNGSGKSTFIKMLSGATMPTLGEIVIGGKRQTFYGPADALRAGIVTVYQELSLIPELSVAENIFLGRLPRNAFGLVDWAELLARSSAMLIDIGADGIAPEATVSSLSVGKQQVVEIVKAMSHDPVVLQLDEPTSALASTEVQNLFLVVRRLRDRGVTIIYISHRLAELNEIADTVTAIRDGHFVGSVPISAATPEVVLEMMFGPVEPPARPTRKMPQGVPALSVRNARIDNFLKDVSFDLGKGEVLGIAGMLGSGRTELLRAIYGAAPLHGGEIFVKGEKVTHVTIETMKKLGVGYTSEDRKHSGLVHILSSHANLCLAAMDRIAPSGLITSRTEKPFVDRQIRDLHIKVSDPDLPVSGLSGGNQQKIVVGNWLNNAPSILLFDEPGRGVDVAAKQQIYRIIWEEAQQGLSSIVVSTELEDLVECCDRVLVLRDGKIVGEYVNDNLDPKTLYAACMQKRVSA